MSEFGILSIGPPLLAIVLAIATKRVIPSLFVGIWAGGIIYTGSFGIAQSFDWLIEAIIADDGFHAQILVFTLLLGSGVALIWRLGGAIAVQNWAVERLESRRKIGLMTWILGMGLFFDDYANTAIVGNTMREASDRLRISREKLSYIVDSTTAPVATIGISSWVAFQLSMINEGFSNIESEGAAQAPDVFTVYLQSIPYNAYAILSIVMVGIIVITQRDYGEMLDAEYRAQTTGAVSAPDADPLQDMNESLSEPNATRPMLRTFLLPILMLLTVTIGGAFWTGYDGQPVLEPLFALEITTFIEEMVTIAGDGAWTSALMWGSFMMVMTAMVVGLAYDLCDLDESIDAILEGFGLMLTAVTILVLAWTIGTVANALGTGNYVASSVESVLSPGIFPALVFLVAAVMSFTMGSSWATMGILTPTAIPVAFELTGGFGSTSVVVGAVFSGAVFGDHTSPISDTTVLSSTFTGTDLIAHVRTQSYYAATVAIISILFYVSYGFFGTSPIAALPACALLLVGVVYGLSKFDARRKGIDLTSTQDGTDGTTYDSSSESTPPTERVD
ncbi:Na+/H+ antiporter NhaC-like protein [Haloterrigena turkmenica DSM 5511]|uniref:Na+/H+ antiporter NhaC-like protein n=1 Tax=Haloterrigena turkmenica (strain ATCC 51198 / DSM 5511 / JCM 9101 / NCIMB 13204 / VKM B-1734 / 4k) TaxID=543526 RepID=D2RZ39_HALTV|nr:Na+/H+ antiporter NhaC family protein [Haloterrigena turkmenica]ADB59963.1 Na+/H+ antiporter NhaC-like protein [Haloterrigena turkmenica DSM 5511]